MIGRLLCYLGLHKWMTVVIMDKHDHITGDLVSSHQEVVCRRCALYGGNVPMGIPPIPDPHVVARGE